MSEQSGVGEIGGYLSIPVFLLVSTYGLLKTVLDVIDRLNGIRNFALERFAFSRIQGSRGETSGAYALVREHGESEG